jgi:hypothetical protein
VVPEDEPTDPDERLLLARPDVGRHVRLRDAGRVETGAVGLAVLDGDVSAVGLDRTFDGSGSKPVAWSVSENPCS